MKTTSFEISKKLAEIGFDKIPSPNWWHSDGFLRGGLPKDSAKFRAYDLETILEALPNKINDKENCNEYRLTLSHNHICYRTKNEIWEKSIVYRNLEESLADMAARFLIELHSQGFVKFNQETDE